MKSPTSYKRSSRKSPSVAEAEEQTEAFLGNNRYEMKQVLGQGAYSEVYLAVDKSSGKEVAIKIPLGDLLEVTEIDILCRFRHPNLLHALECTHNGGTLVIVLPLGKSLKDYLKEKKAKNERLSLGKCKSILFQLASACHFLHATNHYFHCDIKTGNILLVDGEVKLADFGLSYPDIQEDNRDVKCGSVGYQSPQVARGKLQAISNNIREHLPEVLETPVSLIQNDIHALGAVLFECMQTGDRLVPINNMLALGERYQEIPARVTNVTFSYSNEEEQKEWEELKRLVSRMVAPSQANRMSSLSEVFDSPLFSDRSPTKGHVVHIKMEGVHLPSLFLKDKPFKKFWSILFEWLDEVQMINKVSNALQVMCQAMDLFARSYECIASLEELKLYGSVCLYIADSLYNSYVSADASDFVKLSAKAFRGDEFIRACNKVIGYLHGKMVSDNICNFTDNAYEVVWYMITSLSNCDMVTRSPSEIKEEFSNTELSKKEAISLFNVNRYVYYKKQNEVKLILKDGTDSITVSL